jgi:SPP1 gp7 family putative phage head morphogenesis protein
MQKFLVSQVHPTNLKLAIEEADVGLKAFYKKLIKFPAAHVKPELEKILKGIGLTVYKTGSDYARSFFPMEKLGWVPPYDFHDDINKLLAGLDVKPSQSILDDIHKALEEGSGPPVDKLTPKLGYELAKNTARTVIMNVYAKGALLQWHKDGIEHVKRMAVEDRKTCPVCKGINGKEYAVVDLIALPNPQSWDTHPACRCTFIPIINISTYAPHKEKMPLTLDIKVGGNEAIDVPIEYAGLLQEVLGRSKLPFKVKFDTMIKSDYERKNGTLLIHPKTLADEDPLEIIYSEEAEALWPKAQNRVVKEYAPLVRKGFAKSARSWDDEHELFTQNFTAYKLGQLDNDLWSQVFFRSVENS